MEEGNASGLMVGSKVKAIRKQQKKTLKQLAEETGLSTAYLSNLERSIISPTLDQLQKVCSALRINITELLKGGPEEEKSPVVRKEERRVFFEDKGQVKYEMLCNGEGDIEGICITTYKGANFERTNWGHDYDELAIVTQGELCIEMQGKQYYLHPGDSIYIEKHTLHTYKIVGNEECVSYWFYKKN